MFNMDKKLESILEEFRNSGSSSEAAVGDHIATVAENGDGQEDHDFLANECLELVEHAAWLANYLCPQIVFKVETTDYEELAGLLLRNKATFIVSEFTGDKATITTTNELGYAIASNYIDRTTRGSWLIVEYGEDVGDSAGATVELAAAFGFINMDEAKRTQSELYEYLNDYPLKESWIARHFRVNLWVDNVAQDIIKFHELDKEDENGFNKIAFDRFEPDLIAPMAEKAADR